MSVDGGSYDLRVDEAENRLFLTLSGMLDEEAAHEAAEEVAAAAERLEPGFQLVNDITEFRPVSQAATDAIEEGKRAIAEAGVSAVVRVVGDSVTGKLQFDRVAGDDGDGYHVATAESVEQAVEFLEEFRERQSA